MLVDILLNELSANTLSYLDTEDDKMIEALEILEHNFIMNNPISIPFLVERVGQDTVSRLTFALSKEGAINSYVNPHKKWGEISINVSYLLRYTTEDKILQARRQYKVDKYRMKYRTQDTNCLVKKPLSIQQGIEREGFNRAYQLGFKLDTKMLAKYQLAIEENLIKGMREVAKKYSYVMDIPANYAELSSGLLDAYIAYPDEVYNLEGNVSDQRGRAIPNGLKRIGNPIASKDFRACLISTQVVFVSTASDSLNDIYLFIAELVGNKVTSWKDKVTEGKRCYRDKILPKAYGKDLHERIWLERIYAKLDELYKQGQVVWDIPLEIDATASMLQVMGVLLNDKRLLDATNVIDSTNLKDPWTIEGVQRVAVKAVMTPTLYGSSETAKTLLKHRKIEASKDEIKAIKKALGTGMFSLARDFKSFLIKYMDIDTPTYEVKGLNEGYTVEVNKFKAVGAKVNAYTAFDTKSGTFKTFLNHDVHTTPDYSRFKLFSATGLVHNLDSNLMNTTVLVLLNQGEWVIPIHDAMLVLPGTQGRKVFVEQLENLRENRVQVLQDYRESIGAVGRKADIAFAQMMLKVEQLDSSVKFEVSALK